ncbi:hypothetical protein [Rhizobium sp. LCM 4573]|uniref:hypothetical protein n=1 Tax=Rhizobium sp. LCM 4573 TaxID=1848291 RepID=UPI0008D8DBEC|nr:hypothetical protein [Rhizobium sp. LCM 4573]OHV83630.1 hypothetical protein LCM4573_05870 [Rhizobium sp. LCM 4573]
MYYGAYNTHADLNRGNHGFINTWAVVRFESKKDREDFLSAFEHKEAKVVTRKEAEWIHERNFTSIGKEVPVGGLFKANTYWSGPGFQGIEWEELRFAQDFSTRAA